MEGEGDREVGMGGNECGCTLCFHAREGWCGGKQMGLNPVLVPQYE